MTLSAYRARLRLRRAALLRHETDYRRRAALVTWTDRRVCCSPLLHRRYWRKTICGACVVLNEWTAEEVRA